MEKNEAIEKLAILSSGTICTLTGLKRYDDIDNFIEQKYKQIETTDVSECKNWVDVWKKLNVSIKSLKYNGFLNYRWNTIPLRLNEDYVLVKGEPNRKFIHYGRDKVFTFENPSIEFFSLKEYFTLSVEKDKDNNLYYYCNICLPSIIEDNVVTFIDLDIDIVKKPNQEWTVVDEDEFVVNRVKYNYPQELIDKTLEERDKLLDKINNKVFPFNGWIEKMVEKYLE